MWLWSKLCYVVKHRLDYIYKAHQFKHKHGVKYLQRTYSRNLHKPSSFISFVCVDRSMTQFLTSRRGFLFRVKFLRVRQKSLNQIVEKWRKKKRKQATINIFCHWRCRILREYWILLFYFIFSNRNNSYKIRSVALCSNVCHTGDIWDGSIGCASVFNGKR